MTDRVDKCPDAYGLARYQGCPDTDGDGVPDNEDKCPREKGEPLYDGCTSPNLLESSIPKNSGSRNSMPNNMVFVQGGTFTMGCKDGRDSECSKDQKPAHNVTLSDFYIGKYEVTQAEWKKVMGKNPSKFENCENCPVENVSWDDVQEYLKKLNAQNPGKAYRLPTEAEWEYAARGGNQSKAYLYSGSNTLADVGWFTSNSGSKTHSVGELKANELGIFDMSGNIREWCEDDFHEDYKSALSDGRAWVDNPRGPNRVYRGGCWYLDENFCRVFSRSDNKAVYKSHGIGFRVALSVR